MARIRSIKPDFFISLTIADLPLSARLTFIGLWTYVDDNGVGLDDARLIRAAIWPLEEAPDILQRTREDLQRLHEALLLTRYRASGRSLLAVTNWSEHQKVSHPRKPRFPRPEDLPTPPETTPDQESRSSPEPSGNPPETLPSPPETFRPEQGAGSRDIGSRDIGSARERAARAGKPARRATGAPDSIAVTDAMRTYATERGLDPRRIPSETERFLDHHRAKGSTFKDWTAAWRTWMSRAVDYTPRTRLAAASGAHQPFHNPANHDDYDQDLI